MRFNKGDKVKCIRAPEGASVRLGEIYTVFHMGNSQIGEVVFLEGSRNNDGLGYFPDRFEKVDDNMNGIVELNGKKYKVENIPGKGDCLVPVPGVTYNDVVGKILKFEANPKFLRYAIKEKATNEVYMICLATGSISGIFQSHSKLDRFYTVVADSLSEAVKNGLIK